MEYSSVHCSTYFFKIMIFGEKIYPPRIFLWRDLTRVDVRLVMKHGIPVKLPQKQTNAIECQSLTVNLAVSAMTSIVLQFSSPSKECPGPNASAGIRPSILTKPFKPD